MEKQQAQVHSEEPDKGNPNSINLTEKALDFTQSADAAKAQKQFSSLRFLIIILGGIFLAEVATLIVFYYFNPLPFYVGVVIDTLTMIALIIPIIYFFAFRPLIHYIQKSQQAEAALRRSEIRFSKAFYSNPEAQSISRILDECFVNVNDKFLNIFGYSREEVIGRTSTELGIHISPQQQSDLAQHLSKEDSTYEVDMEIKTKGGETRCVTVSTEIIELEDGTCILATFSDITERKQSEERLRRIQRANQVLSECNQILVRSDIESELLSKMCETIVDIGKYRMAWVGLAEQDEAKTVRPVAQAGFEDNYLTLAQITWSNTQRGQGPTGTAIRTGEIQVNQNFLTNPSMAFWRNSALERGYQASIALPIKIEGTIFGALTIYSSAPDAFDSAEVELLTELRNDLAFGITALRERAERKRSDEQLREIALFPTLNPGATVQVNAQGEIKRINPSAAQLGFKVGAQLSKFLPNLLEMDLPACIANEITLVVPEVRLGERFFQWTVRGASQLGIALLYGTDVTERKRAEDEVRQLSSIVEQTADTVVVTNRDGVIEYVNPAFEQLTGYSKEEALGKTPSVIKSGIQDSQFFKNLWDTILAGEIFFGEIANRKKSGELFYEAKTITPLRDAQGNITHFVATGKDITEHKVAEEKLHQAYDELELRVQERTSELFKANTELLNEIYQRKQVEAQLTTTMSRLEAHIDNSPLAVIEFDPQFRVMRWSNEAERIFGWSAAEMIGKAISEVRWVIEEDSGTVAKVSNDMQKGIRPRNLNVNRNYRKDGTIIDCEWYNSALYDSQGQLTSIQSLVLDVTERNQAEEALRENEATLLGILNAATESIWLFTVDGVILLGNQIALTRFGKPAESVIGQSIFDVLSEELAQSRLKRLQEVVATRCPVRFEDWRGEINFEHNFYPVIDADGQITRVAAFSRDITERKHAEQMLEAAHIKVDEERNRLLAVMETLPVGVAILDTKGGNVQANRAYEQMWGGPRPDVDSVDDYIAYKAWWADTGQPIQPEEWASARAVQKGETVVGQLLQIQRFDGQRAYVLNSGAPIFDNQGQIAGCAVAIMDITEQKETEEALRVARDELEQRVQERTEELAIINNALLKEITERKEIERQLRIQTTAMESAANGIIITDYTGKIEWSNPALTKISGYSIEELLGQSTHIFNSGQQDKHYYHEMWNAISTGKVWQGEIINRRKDGEFYVEEQTITPVFDDSGRIPHFIAIKQDITKRKQAEEELEERNVELRTISNAERNQRQFAESLIEAALALNKSINLEEVFSRLLEQIRQVIPYQVANITLLEDEYFYNVSSQGDSNWPKLPIGAQNRLPINVFPLAKKMTQTGKPVIVLDTQQEPDWVVLGGLEKCRSFLSAPLLADEKVIGFVNLFTDRPGFFNFEMRDRLMAFAAHAAVAIQNAWLFEQVRASSERLQSLSRRLVEIQENERLYIARELHDEAGQFLTSLLVDLRLLEKKASQPEVITKLVAEMENSLEGVSESLHRVAMSLRPASLDHLGLVPALSQLVESTQERSGIKINFKSDDLQDRLPTNVETVLYRIVQEALTNVVRHAQATMVDIILTMRNGDLIAIVEDDGIGFDPEDVSIKDRLGLFGMHERAEMIGGKLIIESAPGKGTTLIVEVKYDNPITDR